MEGEHEMTRRYTAADFANARFAEHPDGRTARVDPRCKTLSRWSSGGAFLKHDADLANAGWVPVPTKPTITESRLRELTEIDRTHGLSVRGVLQAYGVEVIPDPEPTDEELLAGIIRGIDDWQSITSPELLAKYLNTAGVIAPKEDN